MIDEVTATVLGGCGLLVGGSLLIWFSIVGFGDRPVRQGKSAAMSPDTQHHLGRQDDPPGDGRPAESDEHAPDPSIDPESTGYGVAAIIQRCEAGRRRSTAEPRVHRARPVLPIDQPASALRVRSDRRPIVPAGMKRRTLRQRPVVPPR